MPLVLKKRQTWKPNAMAAIDGESNGWEYAIEHRTRSFLLQAAQLRKPPFSEYRLWDQLHTKGGAGPLAGSCFGPGGAAGPTAIVWGGAGSAAFAGWIKRSLEPRGGWSPR